MIRRDNQEREREGSRKYTHTVVFLFRKKEIGGNRLSTRYKKRVAKKRRSKAYLNTHVAWSRTQCRRALRIICQPLGSFYFLVQRPRQTRLSIERLPLHSFFFYSAFVLYQERAFFYSVAC